MQRKYCCLSVKNEGKLIAIISSLENFKNEREWEEIENENIFQDVYHCVRDRKIKEKVWKCKENRKK